MDQDRFVALWSRCCENGTSAASVFQGLDDSYGEPHRRYHTGAHIDHCLRQFDLARDGMEHADAIELALWFHDVEYDPSAPDNELRSAERFGRSAAGEMDEGLADQVHRLIMITIHDAAPRSMDEKYVVDIDLSSFGLPWREFVTDSRNVRDEFTMLSDQEFAARNGAFLDRLLKRPSIYSTDFFRDRLEARAQDNIRRQLESLDRMRLGA